MYWRKIEDDEFYWSYLKKTFTPSIATAVKKQTKAIRKSVKTKSPYQYTRSQISSPVAGSDADYLQWEITQAWMSYTFSGPMGLIAAKAVAQAGVGTALGVYPALATGLAIELGADLGVLGIGLTIVDPQHKWSGGMDELGDGMFGMGVDTGLATYEKRLNPSWAWW
jgi:hypothetical protein